MPLFSSYNSGSWNTITDAGGNRLQEINFDAWGNRRDPNTWRAFASTPPEPLFDRGFTGHEHLYGFQLINMNGRMYDPVVSRMLSPDNFVQAPDFSQSFNRYSYAWNNPVIYTDPSGEIIFTTLAIVTGQWWALPMAIGADIGMWQGGSLANGTTNPLDWDYSSGKTWGYMAGGAVVGGASGYVGGAIAAEGGFMANTMGLMAASHVNSVGMGILSGGQTDYTLSFGVASYNFTQGEWGYLGKPGNTGLQNFGYFLGAMANLNDINNLINQTNATLYTQERYADGSKDVISHTGIVDDATGKNLMSFGPNDDKIGGGGFKDQIGGAKPLGGYKKFGLAVRKGTPDYPVPSSLSKSTSLIVNKHLFSGLRGVSKFIPYQGVSTNCVNMSSIGLWLNGIPNIGIHPYLLHYSIAAYNSGFNPYMLNALSTRY